MEAIKRKKNDNGAASESSSKAKCCNTEPKQVNILYIFSLFFDKLHAQYLASKRKEFHFRGYIFKKGYTPNNSWLFRWGWGVDEKFSNLDHLNTLEHS